MKLLKQFMIILIISFIGEGLKFLIPLPVPASIYGMIILFVCLLTGIIKLESVNKAGRFLIEIMPIMFIPAGVGLMTSYDILKPMLLPLAMIIIVTLILVMVVTGKISQFIIKTDNKKEESSKHDKIS